MPKVTTNAFELSGFLHKTFHVIINVSKTESTYLEIRSPLVKDHSLFIIQVYTTSRLHSGFIINSEPII